MAKCKTIEYEYTEPLLPFGNQHIKLIYELDDGDDVDRVLVEAEKVVALQFQTAVAREMFINYGARRLAERLKEEAKLEEEKKDKKDGEK